jgi:hypothetical protein
MTKTASASFIGALGIRVRAHTPMGVAARQPTRSSRIDRQCTCPHTWGRSRRLAAISSRKILGTTEAGGRKSDSALMDKRENPKPL